MYPQKDLYKNVHNSFIRNSQNLETTQIFINRWVWVDKEIVVYSFNGILLNNKKEATATYNMNES